MRNLSITLLIWIICFSVITVSASLTYNWYKDQGPLINIRFKNAAGLIPNQSKIVYRGAQVGKVKTFHIDLVSNDIIVTARVSREIARLLGKDSKFWIVQPEISIERISNLRAIVTGDYIALEPVKGRVTKNFIGLDMQPLDAKLAAGLKVNLKIKNLEGISADSPILYRGLEIGKIWHMGLTTDKRDVLIIAYIYAEYSDLVRNNSYFVNVSGFHAEINLFGDSTLGMDSSLRTLFKGGIRLITPNFQDNKVQNDDVFRVMSADEFLDAKN